MDKKTCYNCRKTGHVKADCWAPGESRRVKEKVESLPKTKTKERKIVNNVEQQGDNQSLKRRIGMRLNGMRASRHR